MREFKFRAWSNEHKRMLYASAAKIFTEHDTQFGALKIMQYTGLKDKNVKEIL